jgi:hypothetical protein
MRHLRLTQKGFDEFMNVVIDETIQHYQPKKDGSKAVKPSEELGRILLKGELRATTTGVCGWASRREQRRMREMVKAAIRCVQGRTSSWRVLGFIGWAASGIVLSLLGIDEEAVRVRHTKPADCRARVQRVADMQATTSRSSSQHKHNPPVHVSPAPP